MHFWTESHLQQIRTQKLPVYRTERKNILNISRDYEQIPSRYKTFFFIPNTHVVITSKLQRTENIMSSLLVQFLNILTLYTAVYIKEYANSIF